MKGPGESPGRGTSIQRTSFLNTIHHFSSIMSKTPPKDRPVKVSQLTYDLLLKVQDKLPGKPTLISLIHEGTELLREKYLPEDKKEE